MANGMSGLRLLSVISLGDGVVGGEGLVVHAGPGGRRTLFVAAEHAPADFVAVDVTDPRKPSVLYGAAIPAGVRSNNLAADRRVRRPAVARRCPRAGPDEGAWRSFDLVAGAFFGLGVAVWDFSSPLRPRELGHFAPGAEQAGPVTGQLNDVFIDDRRVIYSVDRQTDLCYVLEIEGD